MIGGDNFNKGTIWGIAALPNRDDIKPLTGPKKTAGSVIEGVAAKPFHRPVGCWPLHSLSQPFLFSENRKKLYIIISVKIIKSTQI